MNIYPAIDLYEGQVVRLQRGDYARKTFYSSDPARVAQAWEEQGAEWLHIVDLEGAKSGSVKNSKSLEKIREAVRCGIQFGGGLRSLEDIGKVLKFGIDRVVIGTKALDKRFFETVLQKHAARVAVGLDTKDGILQTQGWLESGRQTLLGALVHFNQYPVQTLIYTDIQKDGMLTGPNFKTLKHLLRVSRAKIILSGGVGSIEDIEACAQITAGNFEGVIVGKALYDKKFTLRQAITLLKG